MSSHIVTEILKLGRLPKPRANDPEEVALYHRYQRQKRKLSDSDRVQLAPLEETSRKRGKPLTTTPEALWECMAAFREVFFCDKSERFAVPHTLLLHVD